MLTEQSNTRLIWSDKEGKIMCTPDLYISFTVDTLLSYLESNIFWRVLIVPQMMNWLYALVDLWSKY